MPLYEYKCELCEYEEELLQRYTDLPPEVCENCGAVDSMLREIGSTTFQLKGGGWAKDLYSKPGSKQIVSRK